MIRSQEWVVFGPWGRPGGTPGARPRPGAERPRSEPTLWRARLPRRLRRARPASWKEKRPVVSQFEWAAEPAHLGHLNMDFAREKKP